MLPEPSSQGMDGSRVRDLFTSDVTALLNTYLQFEKLVPNRKYRGAAHKGEDGRYVEALVRSYLQKYLPRNLEALTGFILRPAVKTGTDGRERKNQQDEQSSQLDIIVYDSANFPVFRREGDDVIVPPEGVVGVCSIKKHLNRSHIAKEAKALRHVGILCETLTSRGSPRRGPFLSLLAMGISTSWNPSGDDLWKCLKKSGVGKGDVSFDELIGYIGVLKKGSIFKKRPSPADTPKNATYVWLEHGKDELYLGLQFLLTGILSVYYDPTRSTNRRPGFTGFESGRGHEKELGKLDVIGLTVHKSRPVETGRLSASQA